MQVICISRGSHSRGQEFAGVLAGKLGYLCLGREDLVKEALGAGIKVGELETAAGKQAVFSERLAQEKEHYQALLTSLLCERALRENIVYHGWTGHLLLRGISHVLRIRVVADLEYRIKAVMQRHSLGRKKAIDFIEKVDEDRRRWARLFYGVEWDASSYYDVILNLEQMTIEGAALAMCQMASLPEFQPTPASRKAMEDLFLGSRARLALARHQATCHASLKVHASSGVISVTYLPQQAKAAQFISDVLRPIAGVQEIVSTMAATNILWIGESFSPASQIFSHIIQIAEKWNAAVELLRFLPEPQETGPLIPAKEQGAKPAGQEEKNFEKNGGGIEETLGELVNRGRSGGVKTAQGGPQAILAAIDPTLVYSLIVIGEVFLLKGQAARTRLTRELAGFLFEKFKRPVVIADELAVQYLFGPKQMIRLVLFLLGTAVIYIAVFANQTEVLNFFQAGGKMRILAAAAALLFVPLVAYLYGSAVRLFLKLIRME